MNIRSEYQRKIEELGNVVANKKNGEEVEREEQKRKMEKMERDIGIMKEEVRKL